MINVATSYFYQIRFFKPYMVPVSTAVWDPKWYHNFKDQNNVFVDRNGVINGLRIHPLAPNDSCNGLCRGRENCVTPTPETCMFLQAYRQQLDHIQFDAFLENLEQHVRGIFRKCNLDFTPTVVFIVHEAFDNPCSERWVIHEWFRDNGVEIAELMYPMNNYY